MASIHHHLSEDVTPLLTIPLMLAVMAVRRLACLSLRATPML